jgi:hypothetical protein
MTHSAEQVHSKCPLTLASLRTSLKMLTSILSGVNEHSSTTFSGLKDDEKACCLFHITISFCELISTPLVYPIILLPFSGELPWRF